MFGIDVDQAERVASFIYGRVNGLNGDWSSCEKRELWIEGAAMALRRYLDEIAYPQKRDEPRLREVALSHAASLNDKDAVISAASAYLDFLMKRP